MRDFCQTPIYGHILSRFACCTDIPSLRLTLLHELLLYNIKITAPVFLFMHCKTTNRSRILCRKTYFIERVIRAFSVTKKRHAALPFCTAISSEREPERPWVWIPLRLNHCNWWSVVRRWCFAARGDEMPEAGPAAKIPYFIKRVIRATLYKKRLRNSSIIFFSSLETCTWDIPIFSATICWFLP